MRGVRDPDEGTWELRLAYVWLSHEKLCSPNRHKLVRVNHPLLFEVLSGELRRLYDHLAKISAVERPNKREEGCRPLEPLMSPGSWYTWARNRELDAML